MKRMLRYVLIVLIGTLPFSMSFGQEKKMEKKIKIVTDDGSGNVTVLDTTLTEGKMPATIKLKNGKVINLEEKSSGVSHISSGEGKENISITVISNDDGTKKEEKSYTITTRGDVKDNNVDVTKYVVAKDGMVITVEGNDEAKAKEIIKLVEDKLNVRSDAGEKKEIVRIETKKTIKK